MRRPLFFQPLYYLFWIIYFVVARATFLIYHSSKTADLSGSDILNTFLYGFRLDLSFAAYLSALPFLAFFSGVTWKRYNAAATIRYFTYGFVIFLSLLLSADLELYANWGFRLDATPLQYLSTPGEMVASTAAAPLFTLTLIAIILSLVFILLYKAVFDLKKFRPVQSRLIVAAVSLFLVAFLILPIRGGWQLAPINQSVAHFSKNPYTNHASLNMPWNLMHSLLKYGEQSKNTYIYMDPKEAAAKVDSLYTHVPDSSRHVVSGAKPNVILIILESFTSQFVGSLGGEKGVTPNLNELANSGLNFTNMYASGDRSQKGLVAILSGYPVQPNTSIIKTPKKTEKLPQLSKVFGNHGYTTSFYYGGELEFANIKSYLVNGDYDRLIDKYDFPASSYNSKWGAHDHVVFEKVMHDLKKEDKPFFTTVYTLSSHEPYEIPIAPKFPGSDQNTKFRNSLYYTDWALGKFIEEAKQQPWWKNTLVVIVADHGHPLPKDYPNHAPEKFHIPFILAGRVLAEKGEINTLASQTDIAGTLLKQLALPYQDFKWSRNILAPVQDPFAFYAFNDGFGYLTPQGEFTFDNVSKQVITRDSTVTDTQVNMAKAYMQQSFEDFLKK